MGEHPARDPAVHPLVALVRRWAVDWLVGRHADAALEVLAPEYTLQIGGFALGPRDAYVKATTDQFDRFPGLNLTIHHLITSGDGVAVWFSEHGAAAGLDGRRASWTGVALFGWDGKLLTDCFAEEDYYSRRRQLDAGVPHPVHPPAIAPWNERAGGADAAAEAAVAAWLAEADQSGPAIVVDDEDRGQPSMRVLEVEGCAINRIFSAGGEVAFHATQRGTYRGGLAGTAEGAAGRPATLHVAGMVTVEAGRVTAGRVVRDRLGTARRLRA